MKIEYKKVWLKTRGGDEKFALYYGHFILYDWITCKLHIP